jgi:hypothetical protein
MGEICEPVDGSVRSRRFEHYRDMLNKRTPDHVKPAWKQTYNPQLGT